MCSVKVVVLLGGLIGSQISFAADKPFTGVFRGEGRACYGSLFIRIKTIEWVSSFSKCGPTSYEIIASDLLGAHPKIAYRLTKRQQQCRNEVVELTHYQGDVWSVEGYPSLTAFQHQDKAMVTACSMFKQ